MYILQLELSLFSQQMIHFKRSSNCEMSQTQMRLAPSRWCSPPLPSAKALTLPALAPTHSPKSSLSESCLSVKNISVQFFFWYMTQTGHLYYQMPADFHLYGPSKCLITLRKDDAKTESATGWLNNFIGLRHLSV